MDTNVIVIIPTYNEQESIEKTLLSLQHIFKQIPSYEMRILVFDSASTDDTQLIVKNLQKKFHNILLLSEKNKSGLGSAYIQAIKYVMSELKPDIIFQFDADGSHQPKYIPEMLELLKSGADVVVGSRYIPGGSIPSNWAFYRKFLSSFGNLFIRSILSKKYTDYTSGYRGIKTEILQRINMDDFLSNNYAFLLNFTWALYKAGANIKELPIEFIDRTSGISKLPIKNIYESIKVVLTLKFLQGGTREPF